MDPWKRNLCGIALLTIYSGATIKYPNDTKSLVQLHIIFRHGERFPNKLGFYEKLQDVNKFDCPFGELTEFGGESMRSLGRKLRNQYDEFLGQYNPEEVEAISSDFSRCKESLTNLSTTLYPHAKMLFNYTFTPVTKDKLIATYASCPSIMKSINITIIDPDFQAFCNEISQDLGFTIQYYSTVFGVYDYFEALKQVYQLPKWMNSVWSNFTYFFHKSDFVYVNKNLENSVGNLIYKIANDSVPTAAAQIRKIHLYAAHDFNLIVILEMLNQTGYNYHNVGYGSYIIFEVHHLQGEHYIKIYFDNNDELGRLQIKIPGCGFKCLHKSFFKLAKSLYLGERWCQDDAMTKSSDDALSKDGVILLCTLSILLLLGLIALVANTARIQGQRLQNNYE